MSKNVNNHVGWELELGRIGGSTNYLPAALDYSHEAQSQRYDNGEKKVTITSVPIAFILRDDLHSENKATSKAS